MKMKTDMRPVRLQYFMVEKLSSLIFPVFPFPWQAASTNQTADLSNAESPGLAKVPSPSAKSRAAQPDDMWYARNPASLMLRLRLESPNLWDKAICLFQDRQLPP